MNNEELQNMRHSLAHLLAAAVMQLHPDAKRTIGPAIDNGFYFDFEFSKPISDDDLPTIEAKMREILPTWQTFERSELTADEAKKEYPGNDYKHELINEFTADGSTVSFYKSGDYWDLCRGGHAENMQSIDPDSFKLTKLAGAYWRGDEKNKMLTRIYGLAFATKAELEAHILALEEAKKRDHKVLGPQLDLFVFSELVGAGLPLWTPKGTLLRTLLDDYVWSLRKKAGYSKVEIPHITKKDLYEKSGHWSKFADELMHIKTREGHEFAMKPMNCPHHTQIFARRAWSYRDMPQRYCNTTMCYRDEQSGELAGLSRVRAFAQDDAHVFARFDQAKAELGAVWSIVQEFYHTFGFQLRVRLSMHDPEHMDKFLGDPVLWEKAENILRELAEEKQTETFDGIGEAAFYGPKLDFMAKDSIGREWQVATIQLDMNMPGRFGLEFTNAEGQKETPVMVHAAIMGSIERFLSVLIEHYGGAFPTWLSPVQLSILPISDAQLDYARSVKTKLESAIPDIRIEIDERSESVGKKIREASATKVPYIAVVGAKEIEANSVSIRARGGEDLGSMSIQDLIQKLSKEIETKA
ncbi:MAG: threonine--tRNA ligase [Candidatus Doudnabacteria bacterium]|nr:threonine--tRNA ligase [Candidatus Doudnabacteria bacterium]